MRKHGFTLIEILVVIAIIGILTILTVVSYGAALSRSRDQHRLTDLSTISNALGQYYLDHKTYPIVSTNSNGIYSANFQLDETSQFYGPSSRCLVTNSTTAVNFLTPSYLSTVPQDPQHPLSISGGVGGLCASNSQNGQYAYITNDNNTTPHTYLLMAKMERTTNMATTLPTLAGQFAPVFTGKLCVNTTTDQAPCYANYYLGPKNGQ